MEIFTGKHIFGHFGLGLWWTLYGIIKWFACIEISERTIMYTIWVQCSTNHHNLFLCLTEMSTQSFWTVLSITLLLLHLDQCSRGLEAMKNSLPPLFAQLWTHRNVFSDHLSFELLEIGRYINKWLHQWDTLTKCITEANNGLSKNSNPFRNRFVFVPASRATEKLLLNRLIEPIHYL